MSTEAMKLALEALESCDTGHITDGSRQWYDERLVDKAITALDEALVQPQQELEYCTDYHCAGDCGQPHNQKEMREFLASQPQPEPVAFITPLMEQQLFDDWCPYKGNPDPRVVWAAAVDAVNGLLLGASLPARKPLTDAQINAFFEGMEPNNGFWLSFARAIEVAHGIKGDA